MRRLVGAAAALFGLALGCGSGSEPALGSAERCFDETFPVKVTGTCVPDARFRLSSNLCAISLWALDDTGTGPSRGLPRHGAMGIDGGRVRQGGFHLFGDVCDWGQGNDACTKRATFRVCEVQRVEWWLDVSCADDQGRHVCDARLTE